MFKFISIIRGTLAKCLALTFLMRGFGLSRKPSIKVGFAFSKKGLKFQDPQFRMTKKYMLFFKMFNGFRLDLCIFTTHLTYICLKWLFNMENHNNRVTTAQW